MFWFHVQVFGSKGFVDFWVSLSPTTGWAIELLRNGDRSTEHAARFAKGGIYEGMPMTAFALIDFRQGQGHKTVQPGFLHVVFNSNFSEASVWTRAEGKSESCRTYQLMD